MATDSHVKPEKIDAPGNLKLLELRLEQANRLVEKHEALKEEKKTRFAHIYMPFTTKTVLSGLDEMIRTAIWNMKNDVQICHRNLEADGEISYINLRMADSLRHIQEVTEYTRTYAKIMEFTQRHYG